MFKKSLTFSLILLTFLSLFAESAQAESKSKSNSVVVSARVGEHSFTMFGYTSAFALVSLDGRGIFDQTRADKNGYFVLKNRFSPLSSREACLTAQDQLGRITYPVCLPPFPVRYNTTVGPVIMPPTISLNKSDIFIGEDAILSGQTIPNTNVDFSFFLEEKNSPFKFITAVVPMANALTFPKLKIKSDHKGNFSATVPSSTADVFRAFAQTNYQGDPSPKSTTLNIKILPFWIIFVRLFLLIWGFIEARLLEIFILTQTIIILVYFLRRYLNPHVIAKNKSLILRKET